VWRWLQAWLGRDKNAGHRPQTPEFDVVADLDPSVLPAKAAREAVQGAVLRALQSMPGARRVVVRVREAEVPVVVRVFPAGVSVERPEPIWVRLRGEAALCIRSTLLAVAPPAPAPHAGTPWELMPAAMPGHSAVRDGPAGFAEASGMGALDALADLAALAQSVRTAGVGVRVPERARVETARVKAGPLRADVALTSRLLDLVLPGDTGAVAAAAVSRFGSFAAVLAAPQSELRRVPGLGQHSVAAIKLVHEAAIRLSRARASERPVLDDPARLTAYLAAALGRERVEQFRILFLDDRGVLKADEIQAKGTVNHTPVYPREVVRRALELGASALVLVHNHPSGDPTPSRDDIEMTKLIREGADALSITVRDHIIVGNGRSLSFREAGLLN